MGASDLRVTVDSAKLRCVLDPALVLGHALGPRLALGLTRVFEPWLTRSFWHVLDASELLAHGAPSRAEGAMPPDAMALMQWIAMRDRIDAGSWLLRWVGDCVAESQLRSASDDDLVDRFEWFAAALTMRQEAAQGRLHCRDFGFDPLADALDAVALSAALEGALILSPQRGDAGPWPVQALAQLGIRPERVAGEGDTSLFAAERALVRQALAGAGLAALLQPLGTLAVAHVVAFVPAADNESADPWQQARAWWYVI